MNPLSMFRTDGPSGAALREPINFYEARLWDRARLNLTLLYGGQRGGGRPASGAGRNPETCGVGHRDPEL
jgi:hypothetical protein